MANDKTVALALKTLQPRLPEMVGTLRSLVQVESPSLDKNAADVCAQLIARKWRETGAKVEIIPQKHRGAHLRIKWPPKNNKSTGQLLVLGHYDTVYAAGTLGKMPFRIAKGKAYGPGIFDMKAGIVQALYACAALRELKTEAMKQIVFLWTSDEEIGSESSRKLLESEARRSDAVFVLEPSLGARGLLKTARKGVGEAEIIVHGRASHAGLAPEQGINAIHELAEQIARIAKWQDPRRGVSIHAGIIEGGTRSNVIPARARAVLDLRALRVADMRALEKRLRTLRSTTPGARLEIRGGFSREPLEHKMGAALFSRAKILARQIGLELGECTVGGGSDGNFTAALGVPTLDGLGAVGDGAHSQHEHIVIQDMAVRAALLAGLLATS